MTGQTRAGAAPASAFTATDPITPAAASTLALRACAAAGPLFVAAALVQGADSARLQPDPQRAQPAR